MRILEFGPGAIFARTHPDATDWIPLHGAPDRFPGLQAAPFGPLDLVRLLRLARRPDVGLVACHVPDGNVPRLSLADLAYRALARIRAASLVALDFSDRVPLGRTALDLLERVPVYWKRELPLDRGELVRADRAAARALLTRNLAKVRPISLGLAAWRRADLPGTLPPKSVDVFFAGAVRTDLRRKGLELLSRLRGTGIAVDLAEGDLDRATYFARMARARLAWSPEGLGWQCFRHLEAPLVCAVPILSRPRIEMPHPFREGTHGFFYDPEGDDLLRVVRRALAVREHLPAMAAAARDLVLRHHTHEAVAAEILAAARSSAPPEAVGRRLPPLG